MRVRSARRLRLLVFGVASGDRRVRGTTRIIRTGHGRVVRLRLGDRYGHIKMVRILRRVAGGPADMFSVRVR